MLLNFSMNQLFCGFGNFFMLYWSFKLCCILFLVIFEKTCLIFFVACLNFFLFTLLSFRQSFFVEILERKNLSHLSLLLLFFICKTLIISFLRIFSAATISNYFSLTNRRETSTIAAASHQDHRTSFHRLAPEQIRAEIGIFKF